MAGLVVPIRQAIVRSMVGTATQRKPWGLGGPSAGGSGDPGYIETFVAFGQQGYRASNKKTTQHKQAMSQTVFEVAETQTHIRLAIDNAYYATSSSGSVAKAVSGWDATVSASVVDVNGNFTRVTFGGADDGSVASGGVIISDEVQLVEPIHPGYLHSVRIYYRSASGIIYCDAVAVGVGNNMEFGASISDKTMSGTISGVSGFCVPPFAIIGRASPQFRSVMAIGDSIAYGIGDYAERNDAAYGITSRSLYGVSPNVIMAHPGARASYFLSDQSNISALTPYVDAIVSNYGTNDLSSDTVQELFDNLVAIRQLPAYSNVDFYIHTLCPRTGAGNEPNLVTPKVVDFNNRLRSGEFDSVFTGWFDIAAALEDPANPGTWLDESDTDDYIHPNGQGYNKVAASGVISL